MPMPRANSKMFWGIAEGRLLVKLCGRADFTWSKPLKAFIEAHRQQGGATVVLVLSECLIMDSTFLGTLTGLERTGLHFEMTGPNDRVMGLLLNLGVAADFPVSPAPVPPVEYRAVEPVQGDAGDMAACILGAHIDLVGANPQNLDKFKGLFTELLRANPDVRRGFHTLYGERLKSCAPLAIFFEGLLQDLAA